jgi:hypothetical protein
MPAETDRTAAARVAYDDVSWAAPARGDGFKAPIGHRFRYHPHKLSHRALGQG